MRFETLADIAYTAGEEKYFTGDSRADVQSFVIWSKEFEDLHKSTNWDEQDYITNVLTFTLEKIKTTNEQIQSSCLKPFTSGGADEKKLYAIYKDGLHKGNVRAQNKNCSIVTYIVDSRLTSNPNEVIDLMKKYKAIKAVKGLHY